MAKKTSTERGRQTGQMDLFGDNPTAVSATSSQPPDVDLQALSDPELLALSPKANLSNVGDLCDEVLNRNLGDAAVPALDALWHRFRGYGDKGALPEQRGALDTLARIETATARQALTRIVRAAHPDTLLPAVLQAAVTAGVPLPLRQMEPWLDHKLPEVRVCGFTLAQKANPPAHLLEKGLSDPYPSVRRAALISAGLLEHVFAKRGLLQELDRAPNSQVIEALIGILDEDVLVRLRRCGEQNEALRPFIIDELKATEDPKALKIAMDLAAHKSL